MADPIVGIDLGTTNSVVAACDASGAPRVLADPANVKIHPSVVSFHPNGSVIVGVEGKQRRIIDPRNTVYSAKRLIGRPFRSREIQAAQARMPYLLKEGQNQQPVIITRGGEFAVPEISAIILDHVRNVASGALGEEVTRAVVTVPASFNDAQRSATATAGAIAGITVARVLNEPTAAALAYGYQRQLNRMIAVYDFGGGTFDITVLRLQDQVYEVLGTAGDTFLGGDDIDEVLMQHMADAFLTRHRIDLRDNEIAIMRLRAVAEQTKIELSRRTRAIVKVDEAAYGPGGVPINLEIEIHRDELIQKARPIFERTFVVCEEALRLAGVQPGNIDDIVLVGGTTKIPAVRERVTQFFQRSPRTDVNAEEAVALGAALQATALDRVLTRRQTGRTTLMPPPGPAPVTARAAVAPPPSSGPTKVGVAVPDPTAVPPEPATRTTAPLGAAPFRQPSGAATSTGFDAPTAVAPPPGAPLGAPIAPPVAARPRTPPAMPPVPPLPGRPPPHAQKTMLGIPIQSGPVTDEITAVKGPTTAPRLTPDVPPELKGPVTAPRLAAAAEVSIDAMIDALEPRAPTEPPPPLRATDLLLGGLDEPTVASEPPAPPVMPAAPLPVFDPFAPEAQPTLTLTPAPASSTTPDNLPMPRLTPATTPPPGAVSLSTTPDNLPMPRFTPRPAQQPLIPPAPSRPRSEPAPSRPRSEPPTTRPPSEPTMITRPRSEPAPTSSPSEPTMITRPRSEPSAAPPPRARTEPPVAPPRARTEPPVTGRLRGEPPGRPLSEPPAPRPRNEPPIVVQRTPGEPSPASAALGALFDEPPVPRARRVSTQGIDLPPPVSRATAPNAPTLFDQPAPLFEPRPAPPPASASTPTLIGALAPQNVVVAPPPPSVPVVLDVTPRSLGIGTVAGFCDELIRRNARVPTETRRMFTTVRDQQQTVRIRVCTGESRRIDDNVVLGDLVLEGLPARPRGQTRIEVTFALDASGILNVRARDAQSGQEQRASLDVLGAQSSAEIDAARERFGQLRR